MLERKETLILRHIALFYVKLNKQPWFMSKNEAQSLGQQSQALFYKTPIQWVFRKIAAA